MSAVTLSALEELEQRAGAPDTRQARFLRNVDRRADDECWPWKRALKPNGYGEAWIGGVRHTAQRWAYLLFVGPLDEDQVVDHLCRNRACVNPAHLEAVTSGENVLRGEGHSAENARKVTCVRGHELPLDHPRDGAGRRVCPECKSAASRRWNEENPDRNREKAARYREAHREEINARKRQARKEGRWTR